MVADSEADMGDLFCECADFPSNFDVIIRGCKNRSLVDAKSIDQSLEGQLENISKLDEALSASPVRDVKARRVSHHKYTKKKVVRNEAFKAVLSIRRFK